MNSRAQKRTLVNNFLTGRRGKSGRTGFSGMCRSPPCWPCALTRKSATWADLRLSATGLAGLAARGRARRGPFSGWQRSGLACADGGQRLGTRKKGQACNWSSGAPHRYYCQPPDRLRRMRATSRIVRISPSLRFAKSLTSRRSARLGRFPTSVCPRKSKSSWSSIPRAVAIRHAVSTEGKATPRSTLEIVSGVTPTASASASCVRRAALRLL